MMYGDGKLGQCGIEQLVCSANKRETNACREGQALIERIWGVAKYFSYADRLKKQHVIRSRVGVAAVFQKHD